MDMENQGQIQRLADEYGRDKLMVVLGASDLEGAEISAETLTVGAPRFSGPLAGVQLGLEVSHIMEPQIKALIDPDLWEEKLGMMEMVIDVDGIAASFAKIRETARAA